VTSSRLTFDPDSANGTGGRHGCGRRHWRCRGATPVRARYSVLSIDLRSSRIERWRYGR